ncbi:hypothetical protein [uncultured Sphingomonas sp.]|uniref:hypothetical protein n=1 Tax=uncultured Sphingomonas sp. TaxID=158754 RepID=UPI0025E9B2AC|nr:hypothetical protein [uncultured Sphingomonas sp.]
MRLYVTGALAALLMPALGAQDLPKTESPPASAHPICGGDDVAAKRPTLLEGYGKGGWAISTTVPQAQAFFDNGMQLGAAFAHKASIAAMQEATRLDPACAMCAWGDAWASGPTLNYDKDADETAKLHVRAKQAQALAATSGTPLERALTDALVLRYRPGQPNAGAIAYANAMDALARANPTDIAIGTLAADAMLLAGTRAKKNGRPMIDRSVVLLQDALARDPDYSPAIHFYIHATEIADVPDRATPYADRLRALAPKASHLVHMPSHTYYWIGRYQDAANANVAAVKLGIENAKRLGMTGPDGVWDLPYHAHNVHFGVGGAMMSGDRDAALLLSDPLVDVAARREKGSVFWQAIAGMGYAAEGRFAEPAKVLALPQPKLPYARAFWHYARGEALARLGKAAEVRAEADAIAAQMRTLDDKAGKTLAKIAALVLGGRAAMLDDDPRKAVKFYATAARIEEAKPISQYSDPPVWWYPPRRSLAEARLAMGDARAALAEADATLKRRPKDPMTLSVRARAQAALGTASAAGRDAKRALAGWRGKRAMFGKGLI